MDAPTLAAMASIIGALILVGSGLARRQLSGRRLLRLALVWLGIILLVWGAVTLGQGLNLS